MKRLLWLVSNHKKQPNHAKCGEFKELELGFSKLNCPSLGDSSLKKFVKESEIVSEGDCQRAYIK